MNGTRRLISIIKILSLGLCFFSAADANSTFAASVGEGGSPFGHSLYDRIAQENLRSFASDTEKISKDFTSYNEFLEWEHQNLVKDRPMSKRHAAYALFTTYEKTHPLVDTQVLDFLTWNDLNLLAGPNSSFATYLGSKIDRTNTEFGKVALLGMIVQPTRDIQELTKRQAIVNELVTNTKLFTNLVESFKEMKKSETLLLSYWASDAFSGAAKQKEIRFPQQPYFIEELNKNVFVNEFNERLDQASKVVQLGAYTACAALLPVVIYKYWTKNEKSAKEWEKFGARKFGLTTVASMMTGAGLFSWLSNKAVKRVTTNSTVTGAFEGANRYMSTVTYATGSYFSFDSIKANIKIMKVLHAKLIGVACYVRALKDFNEYIKKNPVLQEMLPAAKKIDHVLNDVAEESKDFKKLLDLLSTDTFKGEPSFFASAGRILTANKLMDEQKDKLGEALVALGEIDAYLSIAHLYKEGQRSKNAAWCFASYAQASSGPLIESEDFWNPFLDPKTVVVNSIAMGTQGNPRSLIITGPNAGGKSTIMMKGIPLCLSLAQTIGIVPARRFHFTPMSKIITYLNITDDIAAGNSHFKAGVLRAQQLVEMAQGLHEGEYGYISADEVFNGTSVAEGEAAGYSLFEMIGKHPGVLCATATHFQRITHLEESAPTLFKNYKVSVLYDEQGHIVYPFKLEPGASHQNVAFDILREEGFTPSFLARAEEILGKPVSARAQVTPAVAVQSVLSDFNAPLAEQARSAAAA